MSEVIVASSAHCCGSYCLSKMIIFYYKKKFINGKINCFDSLINNRYGLRGGMGVTIGKSVNLKTLVIAHRF